MSHPSDFALRILSASEQARRHKLEEVPSAFGDARPASLDSWIEPANADRVGDILSLAADQTPEFLNGILLPPSAVYELYRLLDHIKADLEWGARFQHETNRHAEAAGAALTGVLAGLLSPDTPPG